MHFGLFPPVFYLFMSFRFFLLIPTYQRLHQSFKTRCLTGIPVKSNNRANTQGLSTQLDQNTSSIMRMLLIGRVSGVRESGYYPLAGQQLPQYWCCTACGLPFGFLYGQNEFQRKKKVPAFCVLVSLASFVCFHTQGHARQFLYSAFLLSPQIFLPSSLLFLLKVFFRGSSGTALLIVSSVLLRSVSIPHSFMKDCVAKGRNINGKLCSLPFQGLLPFVERCGEVLPVQLSPSGVMCLPSGCFSGFFSLFDIWLFYYCVTRCEFLFIYPLWVIFSFCLWTLIFDQF